MKTTSKIKLIKSTKEYKNEHGITIYHNLEMENGDKINIGKKKPLQIGWEIDYEITEHGQQEYQKAITPKKEFAPEKKGDKVRIGNAYKQRMWGLKKD